MPEIADRMPPVPLPFRSPVKVVEPVPPLDTARGVARVSAPVDEKDDVAVAPKYAMPKLEKLVVEALVTLNRLVEELKVKFEFAPRLPALLNCTCVSPPATAAEPRHEPLTRTQPPETTSPFAKVDDADVDVRLRAVA